MVTDNHAVLALIDWLIANKGLQQQKKARLKELGAGGVIGTVCADGRYTIPLTNGCSDVSSEQHFLKLHGAGFMLGLKPAHMSLDAGTREYIQAAQTVLMTDLLEAYHEFRKGTVIWLMSHAPGCGKAGKFKLSTKDMILATLEADKVVTHTLRVSESIVLPHLLVDRTPEVRVIGEKNVELHVIKKAAKRLLTVDLPKEFENCP